MAREEEAAVEMKHPTQTRHSLWQVGQRARQEIRRPAVPESFTEIRPQHRQHGLMAQPEEITRETLIGLRIRMRKQFTQSAGEWVRL